MRSTLRILFFACALAAPLASQRALADYVGQVFYGTSVVEGQAATRATDGYTFGFGGISRDDDLIAWRWDFAFDHHDAREGSIPGFIVDDGDLMSSYFRFGPQFEFPTDSGRFYVGVSAGYYWTYANISMYGTVPGYVCDPYWGWCWLVPVTGEFILVDRSEDDLGYSATVGYEWDVIGGSWFIEAQYHLIEHGEGYEIMPVVIGLRF